MHSNSVDVYFCVQDDESLDDILEEGDEEKKGDGEGDEGGSSKKKLKKKRKKNKDKGKTHYDPFSDIALSSDSEEEDNFSIDKFLRAKVKIAQPGVDGLYWMQIEDFVELFNRMYVLEDIGKVQDSLVSKRFTSRWVPGDYIVGSGGPPTDPANQESEDEDEDEASVQAASVKKDTGKVKDKNKDKDKDKDKDKEASDGSGEESSGEEESEEESDTESDDSDNTPADPFTDNPMYPFTVGEPTYLSISLFQADRRWTVSRLGKCSLIYRAFSCCLCKLITKR